jgi:hypothetical protein
MSQLHRSCSDSIPDKPAYPGHSNITLGPYISLAADVCEIKSTVFPNLGSMTQSNISGWLCSMQKQNGEKAQALEVHWQYLTRQNPRWIWDHLVHHCWRFWNRRWWMLQQAIRSYHQTPCRDKYLPHIIRSGLHVWCVIPQIWEYLPTSKAKYHLPWIKRLAIDEAFRTKGLRVVVYFRVPSQRPAWELSQLRNW